MTIAIETPVSTTPEVTTPTVPEPPTTADVLDEIQAVFDRYVVFPDEEARDAVVLWTAHTHVVNAFESTPRLSVCSTEPGSGKSRVLEILEQLTPNPLNAVYVHPAILWRTIAASDPPPTLLLDEVDTVFGRGGSSSANMSLRAILNAGHRKGATVPRCSGTDDVVRFPVYAPVAMAGLGHLPDTISSRSIVVRMKRRRKDQEVCPFRLRFAQAELDRVRNLARVWAGEAEQRLSLAFPELPVQDRAADVWEPLVAIAELASLEWHARGLLALRSLTADGGRESTGVALLRDLRRVYKSTTTTSMFTQDILDALWAGPNPSDTEWTPESLTGRTLSRILAEYGVSPTTVRHGADVQKGYKRAPLEDAWSRYL